MPLNIPTDRNQVKQKAQTDVQNTLPESNPFLPNSYLDAIITAFAGRLYDNYSLIRALILELFPDTAEGDFLERWGSYVGILRKPATQSTGSVTVTGITGSNIPINTQLRSDTGLLYETTGTTSITSQTLTIDSLIRQNQTAVAKTTSDHGLISGESVTIAGAAETQYNGTYIIAVTDAAEFTYTIAGTPTTPATGTITAQSTFANAPIRSLDYGDNYNADGDTPLTFVTPISGVDNVARVGFYGLTGGANQETDDNLRDRILFRYQNPVALFNENAIIMKAKEVPGVTRVYVEGPGTLVESLSVTSLTSADGVAICTTSASHNLEDGQYIEISGADQADYNVKKKVIVVDDDTFAYSVGGTPVTPATGTITAQTSIPNGQVIIYFTRDDDVNIIPTAGEVQEVKDAIVNYSTGIKPANVDDGDVIVKGPIPVTVNFTFSSLTPNTTSMQAAVTETLKAFFRENTSVSEDVSQVSYQAAIFQTIDPETGIPVSGFTLTTPTTDISVAVGEIAVLGSVTYS